MSIRSYRDFDVWKKSKTLVAYIFRLTKTFPKEEIYGLSSQLQRASVSILSNIAEGKSRRTTKEYLRFLDIAYGSVAEVETQLYIACDLGYTTEQNILFLLDGYSEIGKMLNGLINSLDKKLSSPES